MQARQLLTFPQLVPTRVDRVCECGATDGSKKIGGRLGVRTACPCCAATIAARAASSMEQLLLAELAQSA